MPASVFPQRSKHDTPIRSFAMASEANSISSPSAHPQFRGFNSGSTNFPSLRITLPSKRISPPP